jgi:hypothetical protein
MKIEGYERPGEMSLLLSRSRPGEALVCIASMRMSFSPLEQLIVLLSRVRGWSESFIWISLLFKGPNAGVAMQFLWLLKGDRQCRKFETSEMFVCSLIDAVLKRLYIVFCRNAMSWPYGGRENPHARGKLCRRVDPTTFLSDLWPCGH